MSTDTKILDVDGVIRKIDTVFVKEFEETNKTR